MAQALSNPFSIRIAPKGATLIAFQLSSASGGADLPFTLGHAFKKGDVAAGKTLTGSLPGLQVSGKNWWADGSLKFALISGRATLAAGQAQTITLSTGDAVAAADLALADLKKTGITAAVGAGSFGSVSWSGADWDAPFMAWVGGPQMSSWIYRKPVGADAHLVAWLEVRLYAGGAVEVLPWIENGYLKVAGPTNKNATYSFTLGGTQRFSAAIDLPNHCRTVLVAGTRLSYWLGADPLIAATPDKAYLQATRLVPHYRASVPASAGIWSRLAQSYSPLQQGNYADAMPQTGYQEAIGLLPEWDALYLSSNDARAHAGVIVNAYGAGRYPIHFRDESTQRPLRFSAYPNLVVNGSAASAITGTGGSTKSSYTPAASGTTPATWDLPHHPSVGFTAYLLTGRYYFMEEVQFAATLNFLKNSDDVRQFAGGVFVSSAGANTSRGAAWAIRTLAQALCVTPDNDTSLRGEFVASMAANAEFYHATYVAKPNNAYGFVAPYGSYTPGTGIYTAAAWMDDFFTAATGYAIALEAPIPAASAGKLNAFFAWKAKAIIGRLGGTALSDYLYCDAAVYTVAMAPTDTPDFSGGTGPWYASWGDIYSATQGGAKNPGAGGNLRGGNYPEATSYWGNLQPAIAYAVELNVPGALAAYTRMVSASNWSAIVTGWNSAPVWSVAPRNV